VGLGDVRALSVATPGPWRELNSGRMTERHQVAATRRPGSLSLPKGRSCVGPGRRGPAGGSMSDELGGLTPAPPCAARDLDAVPGRCRASNPLDESTITLLRASSAE